MTTSRLYRWVWLCLYGMQYSTVGNMFHPLGTYIAACEIIGTNTAHNITVTLSPYIVQTIAGLLYIQSVVNTILLLS